jgi:hypothetical protein
MKVVANTTPLISLAAIGRLDEMVEKGRWYSGAVCRSFLDKAGEL